MARILIWASAAMLTIVLAIAVYLVMFPGLALTRLQDQITGATGRGLTVSGGAHLEVVPQLALRLDDVALANPKGVEGNVLLASSIRVALSFADLLRPGGDTGTITLVEPRFSFLIDQEGQTNWQLPDAVSPVGAALENAEIAFLDLRNGQAYKVGGLNAAADLSGTGELNLEGTAILNGAFSRVRAYVKAPNRIAGDGSPVDLGLEAPALKASFSGRLAAASSLGLAGPISLSGNDLRAALTWAGVPLGGSQTFKAFSVSGGLDSQGRAFTVNNAEVTLDGLSAKGRVGLDLTPATPVILADLAAGRFDADQYLGPPAADNWNTRPLGLEKLKGVDAQFSLAADDIAVRGYSTGPAKLTGRLADGSFMLGLEAGRLESQLTLDAGGIMLDVLTTRPLFTWLEGQSTLSLKVSGKGKSEAAIVSTLQGEAEISVGEGTLRGIDIQSTATQIAAAVQEGWPRNGATPFDTARAKLTIAEGIADATAIELANPALRVTGKGEVDFLRQALDLKFEPRLLSGTTSSAVLPVAVAIRGPWTAPKIFPDLPDILIDPESAYRALRVMEMPAAENN